MRNKLIALAVLLVTYSSAQEPAKKAIASDIVVRKMVAFTYPEIARKSRIAGNVLLKVTTNEMGLVTKVDKVSGHPMLRDDAAETIKSWQFACLNCSRGFEFYLMIEFVFDEHDFRVPGSKSFDKVEFEMLRGSSLDQPNTVTVVTKLDEPATSY